MSVLIGGRAWRFIRSGVQYVRRDGVLSRVLAQCRHDRLAVTVDGTVPAGRQLESAARAALDLFRRSHGLVPVVGATERPATERPATGGASGAFPPCARPPGSARPGLPRSPPG